MIYFTADTHFYHENVTEHLNTWRWFYSFQADSVRAKVIYARDGENWCRFVQAAFQRLQTDSISGGFIPVGGFFWGHPAMLEFADEVTSNRLFSRSVSWAAGRPCSGTLLPPPKSTLPIL